MLVCNIGNTNITMAFFINGAWSDLYRISSRDTHTSDEYRTILNTILPAASLASCEAVAVASVVPSLNALFFEALHIITRQTVLAVHAGLRVPILNPQQQLGHDLLANAVASFVASPSQASVTADFGTALTLTAVRKNGEVAGVSISPGLSTALQALVQNAAQLTAISLAMPQHALGTTTEASINAGLMLGYKHLTRGIALQMQEELGEDAKFFATGGFVKYIAPACGIFDVIDSYHTLNGIRIIAEHNL